MGSNGSFYQNGLPISSANGGVGNVPPGAPAPKTAESSFYLSGSVYATLMDSDALLAAITAQQALATNAATASQASNVASGASATASASSASSAAASLATLQTTALLRANNLSDLASVPTAKLNLSLVKGDVGLGNVDNTSDVNKPVSTAQAAADALKANIASPTFTGVPTAPTATVGTNTTQLATTAFVLANAATPTSAAYSVKGNATRATAATADVVSPILTSIQVGYTGAPNGTRIDARDPTLTNNTAVYTETSRSVASVSNDTVTTVNSVTTTGNDSGATRAVMRNLGTANGYPASTKGAFVRAIEGQTLVDSSIPNDANRTTWAMELGLHSQLAGNGVDKNVGIYLASSHAGWLPSGVRNDTALLITGADGWTNGILYQDTNGASLFQVDQTGTVSSPGASLGNLTNTGAWLLQGTTTPATLTASVNDFATSQWPVLRLSSNASWNITGIAAQGTGLVHKLINVGTFPIVLTNEDPLSLAANRFHIGGNYVLPPGATLDIWYDSTLARWTANVAGQLGTALADNAQAGAVGEYVSSTVAFGAPVSFVSGTTKDVTSISLPAGDWDVMFLPSILLGTTTNVTRIFTTLSTAANTANVTAGNFSEVLMPGAGVTNAAGPIVAVPIGPVRFSLAATTTIFGNATVTWNAGATPTGAGVLRARRVR